MLLYVEAAVTKHGGMMKGNFSITRRLWNRLRLQRSLTQPHIPVSVTPGSVRALPTVEATILSSRPPAHPLTPHRLPDPAVPVLCPACHGPTTLQDEVCLGCGLIFHSRIPAALHTLTGYSVLRPLGAGGMSNVYLAYDQAGDRLCVIKTLASVADLNDPTWRIEAAHCLHQEAKLLEQIQHPNIASLLDWVSDHRGDFLVLKYVAGPTLEQQLTHLGANDVVIPGAPLPPGEALRYAASIADTLGYLSSLTQPVVHLDIKPANLILAPDRHEPVLVDFGGAIVWQRRGAITRLYNHGTPGYAAPEQYGVQSSPRSDIYSLGATLYHLLTDDDPRLHPLNFPALADLPDDIVHVLMPALRHDPAARPDATELSASLREVARAYVCPPSVGPTLTTPDLHRNSVESRQRLSS